MKIQGVLFDFNGTLFQDTQLHVLAWKAFLQNKIGRMICDEEFRERIFGRDNIQVIRFYFPHIQTQEEWIALSEEKEEMYREMCRSHPEITHLVHGAEHFFDRLKEKKILFTIATGANKSNVDYYFEEFGLSKWFDYDKIIYDDGFLPGKPDPTVYRLAAQKIGVDLEACIVFEDSPAGVQAARKANVAKVICMQNKTCEDVDAFICDFEGAEAFL